ncbi:MAG: hypothetical protein HKN32_03225 [Flavobacteriales bacterium]|nr:hypothetical protein [Flavobacteriales bacterium]
MKRSTRFIFFGLSAYVVIQFLWWAILLVSYDKEIREFSGSSEHSNLVMIIGEGTVFFTLLIAGIVIIYYNLSKASKAARADRNFMLAITHELKTPLASNRLMLQTIREKDLPTQKRNEILDAAILENQRLSGLTDNILLAAQMERTNRSLSKFPVNLSTLTEELVKYSSKTFAREHSIHTKIEEDVYVMGDETSLQILTSNLLENACKYSEKHTEIVLELSQSEHETILKMLDQGVGIPAEESRSVFRKFYRIGDENTRQAKGSGLGLYISQLIVKWHGGEITTKPNKPTGSIFTVKIPIEK